MNKHSIALLLLLSGFTAQAQNKQKVNIDHVTVFLNGAVIESSGKLALPQGASEVLFTNVAGDITEQSISIGASGGVVIQSATSQNNYLSPEQLSPGAKAIKDSIDLLTGQVNSVNDKKAVIAEQLDALKQNKKIAGANSSLSVAELQKLLDLISARMYGLLTETHTLDKQAEKLNKRIGLLQQQLDEEQQKNIQPGGQLLVRFYATQATTTTVNISYLTPNAHWTPGYDIRADKINSPVKLVFKANINQNSGVQWNNVRLSLSTGNPNEGAEAPVMNPWYLSFYQQPRPLAYNRAALAPMMKDMKTLAYSEQTEAVTADAGMNDYVQVDNSGVNTSYDIDLAYTIPADGQNHLVAVKNYELPATYRYVVTPKLDPDVFLTARITDWEDLNLMPATTHIFYEGTYVGEGFIDMRNVKDTLSLSLGRDKKIIVRREQDKDYRSVKMIGSNARKTFAYTISVRNTRKDAIALSVQDQFPVSNDKDISVEDKEAPGANIDDSNGAVRWDLNLKPGELQTLKLQYTVKYPKDKIIGNL